MTRRLLSDGFNSMLLWVLEDNRPAIRFYESLGGERVGRKTVTIGEADLVEVSYGWREIAGLVNLHADEEKLSGTREDERSHSQCPP